MTITDTGKTMLARAFGGDTTSNVDQIAFGSVSATSATSGDTALGSQVDSLDLSSTSYANAFVEYESILPTGSPSSQPVWIRECGAVSSTGSLMSRNTVVSVNKTDEIELQEIVTFKFEHG